MKIVLNKCFGGFGLSDEAWDELGIDDDEELDRTDERLVEVVERLGDRANDSYSKLKVYEIPTEATDYEIQEYDGIESLIVVVDGKIRHISWQ